MKYIRILWSYICGLLYMVWMCILPKKPLVSLESDAHPHVVVTLTSYGRRVGTTVIHVLKSLLLQSRRPDRIILWLDNINFSHEKLPARLARFCSKYGIEIRFCEDIRSYKKLVPALQLCPNDILVTVDDDLVYKRGFLKSLCDAHEKFPADILCTLAHCPETKDGEFLPYKEWKQNVTLMGDKPVFPLGGAGTLYPPKSLHADVINKELFMKLAPQADDIWFWAMAVMAGTRHRLIDFGYSFYQIDLLYQKLHKNSSLMSSNLHKDCNDVQIRDIMEHYSELYNKWSSAR